MRICCGSWLGRCVLFTNILDSLTAPCLVYNTAMYTVYGWCGQYGRCMVYTLASAAGVANVWFIRTDLHHLCRWMLSTSWDRCPPFGHNRHGPKIAGLCPFGGEGAGSPSNTMSPGPRPTSLPSGISIHPAVWPQQTWGENWGLSPLGEDELGPHLTPCRLGQGLPAY